MELEMGDQPFLLNPGPVNISEGVRRAFAQAPDMSHRQEEFDALMEEVRAGILRVADLDPAEFEVFVLASSGTGAMEAGLTTFVDKAVVLDQGVYGDRMVQILERLGRDVARVGEEALAGDPAGVPDEAAGGEWFCFVHMETTLGQMNDWSVIDRAREVAPGARILVDAISSFGATEVDWSQADVILGVANKCLHAIAGASFVIVRRDVWDESTDLGGGFYFDLRRYRQGSLPFTMPPQVLCALRQALAETTDVGERERRYRRLNARVWQEAERVGLEPVIGRERSGHVIASFYLPAGVSYEGLYEEMRARGFVIYSGQGSLKGKIFRIANMGAALDEEAIRRFFDGVASVADSKSRVSSLR